jgi:hypothetical protein
MKKSRLLIGNRDGARDLGNDVLLMIPIDLFGFSRWARYGVTIYNSNHRFRNFQMRRKGIIHSFGQSSLSADPTNAICHGIVAEFHISTSLTATTTFC